MLAVSVVVGGTVENQLRPRMAAKTSSEGTSQTTSRKRSDR
jgi:hypothetical protein